jgi:hypothetical protein
VLAGAALGAGFAGFGAAELFALDPLEGELAGFAAGLGALALLEPEPLDEELAGFGATCGALSPPPPPGPPATLATVRTTAEDGDTVAEPRAVVVVVLAGESKVPTSHTSATPPSSTDTDPARHTRTSSAASIRTGAVRDTAGTGTGGTARMRHPPVEATDTITSSPRVSEHGDSQLSRSRSINDLQDGRQTATYGVSPGVSGAHSTQIRPNGQPR